MYTRGLSVLAAECGGLAECAGVYVTDVGSELARELIAEADSAVELRESGSNSPCSIGLAVEIHFDLRLQYQALGEVQIVVAFKPSCDVPSVANIKCWRKIEEVG